MEVTSDLPHGVTVAVPAPPDRLEAVAGEAPAPVLAENGGSPCHYRQ